MRKDKKTGQIPTVLKKDKDKKYIVSMMIHRIFPEQDVQFTLIIWFTEKLILTF